MLRLIAHACDQSDDGSVHRQVDARRHYGRAPTRGGGGGRGHGACALAVSFCRILRAVPPRSQRPRGRANADIIDQAIAIVAL